MWHLLSTDTQNDLYLIWDWMQAVMGLLLDWSPIF